MIKRLINRHGAEGILIRLKASVVNWNTKDKLKQEFGVLQDYKVGNTA